MGYILCLCSLSYGNLSVRGGKKMGCLGLFGVIGFFIFFISCCSFDFFMMGLENFFILVSHFQIILLLLLGYLQYSSIDSKLDFVLLTDCNDIVQD